MIINFVMKKMIIFLISLSLLFSCDVMDRPYHSWIQNDTEDTVTVAYTKNDGTEASVEIAPGEKFDIKPDGKSDLLSSVWVYNGSDRDIRDNTYAVSLPDDEYQLFTITKATCHTYTLEDHILAAKWNAGDEALYLTEVSGRIGRYYPTDSLVKITEGMLDTVDVYTDEPGFLLVDAEGEEKTTLNGYPVHIRIEGTTIFVE